MKTCIDCDINKEFKYFSKSNTSKDKLMPYCKECASIRFSKYRKTKNGLITIMYSNQKKNSKPRGHIPPVYTKEELKKWILSQKNFNDLFSAWVESGYSTKLTPSIDRLDDYKPYTLDNIRLITWKENNDRIHSDVLNGINTKPCKAVMQFSLSGDFIAEYHSYAEAQRKTGAPSSSIYYSCNNESRKAGGFKWKHSQP